MALTDEQQRDIHENAKLAADEIDTAIMLLSMGLPVALLTHHVRAALRHIVAMSAEAVKSSAPPPPSTDVGMSVETKSGGFGNMKHV